MVSSSCLVVNCSVQKHQGVRLIVKKSISVPAISIFVPVSSTGFSVLVLPLFSVELGFLD